ncbi:MAG: patatin-like phospholipase family protein [Candidatus Eremiobacteraeota bacterium]|nr:patatin-like phospholipase family protein [Candidatus Eremiobacteraeota bacterium]
MRALILSGGGARGAYEAGVAISLLEQEDFEIICGASIGAINGALIAQGDLKELERVWRSMASLGVIRLAPEIEAVAALVSDLHQTDALPQRAAAILKLYQLHSAISANGDLTRLLGALSSEPVVQALANRLRFAWLKRTLVVSTTNITRGTAEAFYHFAGFNKSEQEADFRASQPASHRLTPDNYVPAVCASAAVPGAFQPVTIATDEGTAHQYLDGSISNDLVSQAIDAGASDLTVIYMDRADLRPPNVDLSSIADIGLAVQEIRQERILESDLRLCRTVNKAVLAGTAPGKRFVSIRTICPQTPLRLSVIQFDDQELMDAAFDQGMHEGALLGKRAS